MHQVLRQIVEVDVLGDERFGLAVQREIGAVCRRDMAKALEAAFAPFDADGAFHFVDRLEVDLGRVPLERLDLALTASLSAAVATTLRDRGALSPPPVATGHPARMSPREALETVVLHFLRHGRLPWWHVRPHGRSLEEELVALLSPQDDARAAGTSTGRRAAFFTELARLLRSAGNARERLILHFTPACVSLVLERIDAALHALVAEAVQVVSSRATSPASRRALEDALFERALSSDAPATAQELLRTAAVRVAGRLDAVERAELADDLGDAVQTPLDESTPVRAAALAAAEPLAEEGLLVGDAGVVLLHPFLPAFFAALGVAEGDTLPRPSRAALLVHHLATGALEAEEHELVLAKVLCGIAIESPVPREATVTDAERAEALVLLDSAIGHWPALRSTSADGLRGNFLARNGRLEPRGSDWLLRVESRPYDVLLDALPWGIGHVQLPWMRRLVHVEWPA